MSKGWIHQTSPGVATAEQDYDSHGNVLALSHPQIAADLPETKNVLPFAVTDYRLQMARRRG
ncbi:DUF3684 domain-containing protein [Mesorhizobium muleiense]|uniref:DUF3684 domain-containing protein n=1 Tax=Mesorhizobium muleiense TaxID=1004279 RepID=UPI001F19E708|nr:DUF3684 domain-containing protein [Mesorhizobium muleiense]MCF6121315.1 DUF3684 domain-containing protein [Mesorhizobium muleiense]